MIFLLPAPAQDMPAESMCADVMSSCTGPLDLHGFKALTTPTYFQLLTLRCLAPTGHQDQGDWHAVAEWLCHPGAWGLSFDTLGKFVKYF